jgi:hypothetical protein
MVPHACIPRYSGDRGRRMESKAGWAKAQDPSGAESKRIEAMIQVVELLTSKWSP